MMFQLTHLLGGSCAHFFFSPNLTFPFLPLINLSWLACSSSFWCWCSSPFTLPALFISSTWLLLLSRQSSKLKKLNCISFGRSLPLFLSSDLIYTQAALLTTSQTCSIWLRCVKSPSSHLLSLNLCWKIHSQEKEVDYIHASENGKNATGEICMRDWIFQHVWIFIFECQI